MRPSKPLPALLVPLLLFTAGLATSLPAEATTASATSPYFADFETPAGPEWSVATRTVSPNGAHTFLGTFYQDTVTLTLGALPAHDELRIRVKLHIIESWDGETYGPDSIRIGVAGGPTLMHASFSNIHDRSPEQSFPQPFGSTPNVNRNGASATDTLGYSFFGDATYDLEFVVPHTAPTVVIEFEGRPDQVPGQDSGPGNDRWGLDDVRVTAENAAPILFADDLTSPPLSGDWRGYRGTGDAQHELRHDAAAGSLYLTTAEAGGKAAAIFADATLPVDEWEAEFRFRSGGGSGADGLVFLFYKDEAAYLDGFSGGEFIGFDGAGYGIELDNYVHNLNDRFEHEISLIQGHSTSSLRGVSDHRVEDNAWHHARVSYRTGEVRVAIDGVPAFHYPLVADTTHRGFGFSSGTGGHTNDHVIDDVVVRAKNGLLAHWTFDEGVGTIVGDAVGDTSGSFVRSDGTPCLVPGDADCPTWGAGVNGGALLFPATAQTGRVEFPATDALDGLGGDGAPFTVAFWIREDEIQYDSYRSILRRGPSHWDRTPGIWFNPSSPTLHATVVATGSGNHVTNTVGGVPLGEWTHLAMVHDGGSVRTYIDGVADASTLVPGATVATDGTFYLHDATAHLGFIGALDDFRLYGRALSGTEIAALGGASVCAGAALELNDLTLLAFPGTGTAADPHVVQDLVLTGKAIAIAVRDTQRHVVIRNATLEQNGVAICVQNAPHVRVELSVIRENDVGVETAGGAGVVLSLNEIFDNVQTIVSNALDELDVEGNFWGSPTGPAPGTLPEGIDDTAPLVESPRVATDFLIAVEGVSGNPGYYLSNVTLRVLGRGGTTPPVMVHVDGSEAVAADGVGVRGAGEHHLIFTLDTENGTVDKSLDFRIDLETPYAELNLTGALHLEVGDTIYLSLGACIKLSVLDLTSEIDLRGQWLLDDVPIPEAEWDHYCPAGGGHLTWGNGTDAAGHGAGAGAFGQLLLIDGAAPTLELLRPLSGSVSIDHLFYERYGPALDETAIGHTLRATPASILMTHAIVVGNVSVRWDASDAGGVGIERFDLAIDGELVWEGDGDARSLGLDTSGVTLGEHVMTVTATDRFGRSVAVDQPLLVVSLAV